MNDTAVNITDANYRLFSHEIDVEVLHAFKRYVPDIEASLTGHSSFVEGFTLELSRLNEFILTVLFCMSDNERDTTSGRRQIPFHDTFVHAFPRAVKRVIGPILVMCRNGPQ